MARTIDYTVHLEADDEITPAAEKAASALDKLESQGDIKVPITADTGQAERDIAGLLSKVDKLGGEAGAILLTSNAAAITNEIADLIIDIDKLDAADPTVDIKVDQVQQLQGDLDRVAAKAKEIGSTPVSLDTSRSVSGLNDVARSADSSKSVLANMVGNATQDLGALGGIAGSAGVAIGQMGEYMVDAANSGDKMKDVLRNFAAVAGPIALVATAVGVATGVMQEQAAAAEASAERTKAFGKAMDGAADDSVGLADALRESDTALTEFDAHADGFGGLFLENLAAVGRNVPVLGGLLGDAGANIADLTGAMDDAGFSVYDFATAIENGGRVGDVWWKQLKEAADTGKISAEQYDQLSQAIEKYGIETTKAGENQAIFNVDQAEANAILQESIPPLEQYTDLWNTLFTDMADGSIDTQGAADAINQLAVNLGLTREEVIGLAQGHLDEEMENAAKAAEEAAAAQAKMASAVSDANIALIEGVDASGAFAEALTRVNEASQLDFSQMALDTVESFDTMKESLTGLKGVAVDWSNVDLSPDSVEELRGIPDELAAVTDGISGMRDTIQTELQAAFDTGGIDAYTAKAQFFSGEVLAQFPGAFRAAGAGAEDAARLTQDLLSDLGLLPEDVQIMIRLTREEEARNALAAFSSVIGEMPDEVQVAINTKIAEGDIAGALAILNSQLIQRGYPPIVLPVDAEISAAVAKANEAQAYADSLVGTEAVDADIAAAQAAADAAKAHADSLTATMPLNADGTPAYATAAGVAASVAGTPATMPLNADGTPAQGEIANVKTTADATEGTVNIGASITDAIVTMATINAIVAALKPPPIPITADATGAVATAATASALMQSLRPIIPVAANTAPATTAAVIAAAIIQALRPIITVAANPAPAIAAGQIAAGLIAGLRPVMSVAANTNAAVAAGQIAAGVISGQRAVIPVSAQLRDYPSAASIAGSIGVVRVPIDAYIRTMPRINGAVPI